MGSQTTITTYYKDPDAILDYSWDWNTWLAAGEWISTGTLLVPPGLNLVSLSVSTGTVIGLISSGTLSNVYSVTCRVVTTSGRQDDRSIFIMVEER